MLCARQDGRASVIFWGGGQELFWGMISIFGGQGVSRSLFFGGGGGGQQYCGAAMGPCSGTHQRCCSGARGQDPPKGRGSQEPHRS